MRVHRSKLVAARIEAHEAQIRLFHLPPYSPEYNPDEYLNNDLKQNPGSRSMVRNVDDLEANTTEFMENLADDPNRVMAYFGHPRLKSYRLG